VTTTPEQPNKRSAVPTPKRNLKTGTWGWIFDSVHPNPDGTRRQIRRRGFVKLSDAKEELERELKKDAELYAPVAGGLTVTAVVESYLRAKGLAGRSANTIAQYKWAGKIITDRWGGWDATKLTGDHLEAAYAEMLAGGRRQWKRGKGTEDTGKPMSRRSIEVVHKTAKAAFQLAVDRGQLIRNPAALIGVGTVRNEVERPYWTPQQVGTFLAFAATRKDIPIGLVEFMADTGARAGEVAGIHWANLDLDAGTVTITGQLVSDPEDSKSLSVGPTKRPRSKSTIGLHPATVAFLKRRKSQQASDRLLMGRGWPKTGVAADLVFTWKDGRAIHPKTLSRIIARLAVKANLPRITAHGLRHSFATAALKAKVPVEVVAHRMGNTARMVQEVYAHIIPADDAGAAQLVGDLYRTASDS
jgi:integrase